MPLKNVRPWGANPTRFARALAGPEEFLNPSRLSAQRELMTAAKCFYQDLYPRM